MKLISEPKVVYLIVHVTRQENFKDMQSAAISLLNTITENDLAAVWFQSTSHLFQNESLDSLKAFITNEVFSNEETERIELSEIFDITFRDFERVYNGSTNCSGCQGNVRNMNRIILFLSDSSLSSELPTQIDQLQPENRVDIFTFSFGGWRTDTSVHQAIACSNGGEWFEIKTKPENILEAECGMQFEINNLIPMYLNFYPSIWYQEIVLWTEVGMADASKKRKLESVALSACVPVFQYRAVSDLADSEEDDVPLLLGVTCVEVERKWFDKLDGSEEVIFKSSF